MRKTIVIATRNKGKLREFRSILSGVYDEILSLADFERIPEIRETGNSFRENAFIKAKMVCDFLNMDALGDDSGLVVDALGGAPGIYSARYAGELSSDDENNQKLLFELSGEKNRNARFICCIVLALLSGKQMFFEGECAGQILTKKRGAGGFGYDPVFYISEYGKTMAELPTKVKNTISHRAVASGKLLSYISSQR